LSSSTFLDQRINFASPSQDTNRVEVTVGVVGEVVVEVEVEAEDEDEDEEDAEVMRGSKDIDHTVEV
jgi:hypothetical protein